MLTWANVFSKVLDQIIRATLIKITPSQIHQGIYLDLLLFHSSFVRKNVFYRENIQYTCNFCGTDLHENVQLGSKYVSGIGFSAEKVYRMSVFIWCSQSRLQRFVLRSLVAADKLNTLRLLNKNTISLKQILVLCYKL